MGSKKRPFYRIIATDSRNPRDGRFIETLGYYNPITDPPDINVKEDLVFNRDSLVYGYIVLNLDVVSDHDVLPDKDILADIASSPN